MPRDPSDRRTPFPAAPDGGTPGDATDPDGPDDDGGPNGDGADVPTRDDLRRSTHVPGDGRRGRPLVRGFGTADVEVRATPSLGRLDPEAGRSGSRGSIHSRHTAVSALAFLALVTAFLYDRFLVHVYLVPAWEWDPTRSDWLFLASLWLLATLASRLVPNRALAVRYWGRLRADRAAVAALVVLGSFFLVGLAGPPVLGPPEARLLLGGQPPVGLSVDATDVAQCAGRVTSGRCHGSLAHPFGTDRFGYDVLTLVVAGSRLALYVAVITAAIVVPIGAAVGAAAGFYGGRVDAVLSRYVDVQQTIPAVVAYVVLVLVIEKSLFMLVVVFGLFSWGGVARVVRAETRQRRDADYVRAAEGLGGPPLYRLRRHVLPNVSHGVVTAFGQQVPLLLVTEAAIAYLDLNAVDQPSWGRLIANGVASGVVDQWWVATAGVAALAGTTLAFKLAADALRDALDPTG